jgi:hypothetical protein
MSNIDFIPPPMDTNPVGPHFYEMPRKSLLLPATCHSGRKNYPIQMEVGRTLPCPERPISVPQILEKMIAGPAHGHYLTEDLHEGKKRKI